MTDLGFELEVREDPAEYITFDLSGAGRALASFGLTVYGWSLRNVSTTTEAFLDIYDGTDASGIVIFPVNLAGNETSREWFNRGVDFKNGLYVNVTAQEVKGSLFYRHHGRH